MSTVPRPERKPVTFGLVADVLAVLSAHGYQRGDDQALGTSYHLIGDLVDGYEGRIDSLHRVRTYPTPAPKAVPGE